MHDLGAVDDAAGAVLVVEGPAAEGVVFVAGDVDSDGPGVESVICAEFGEDFADAGGGEAVPSGLPGALFFSGRAGFDEDVEGLGVEDAEYVAAAACLPVDEVHEIGEPWPELVEDGMHAVHEDGLVALTGQGGGVHDVAFGEMRAGHFGGGSFEQGGHDVHPGEACFRGEATYIIEEVAGGAADVEYAGLGDAAEVRCDDACDEFEVFLGLPLAVLVEVKLVVIPDDLCHGANLGKNWGVCLNQNLQDLENLQNWVGLSGLPNGILAQPEEVWIRR